MLSIDNVLNTICQVVLYALLISILVPAFIKNWKHSKEIKEHYRCVIRNPKG